MTGFLSHNPTSGGLLRALLLLGMLWWAWSAYAWLTNNLDPEEGAVRLAMLAAVAAMLIVSLAAPRAFGDDGVIFGVAYLVVRALHLVLFAIAGRGDRDLLRAVARIVPGAILGAALLLVGGSLHGATQLVVWIAAVAVTYLGALLGHMRGWRVSPEHFVERFGLIIIIQGAEGHRSRLANGRVHLRGLLREGEEGRDGRDLAGTSAVASGTGPVLAVTVVVRVAPDEVASGHLNAHELLVLGRSRVVLAAQGHSEDDGRHDDGHGHDDGLLHDTGALLRPPQRTAPRRGI